MMHHRREITQDIICSEICVTNVVFSSWRTKWSSV